MIGHIIGQKPNMGLVDPLNSVRLRIGVVDNPTFNRKEGSNIDPLNPVGVVNMSSGKICIRWLDEQGGLIRPPSFEGKTDYKVENVEGHGKVAEVIKDASSREMLTLSHPMMWASKNNWCGMHYLPPVGSIVIIGFRKHDLPILLGYLQPNYEICNPIKLGEIMIKGYGKNYSYWKQSSRLEHRAWSSAGDVDLETKSKNSTSFDASIKLDAHKGTITLDIKDGNGNSSNMTMTPQTFDVKANTINLTSKSQNINLY